MELRCLLLCLAFSVVRGQSEPAGNEFALPGPGDSRSPCPYMNALANHGFLPRNGMNISRTDLEQGFQNAMNFQPGSLADVTTGVLSTGSNGGLTFNLADSVKHNVVEHDGSLSRNDAAFGDALSFNAQIWNQSVRLFTEPTISIETAVQARGNRLAAAKAVNPQFNLTDAGAMGSFGESALTLILFGDRVNGGANTQFVRTIFEQERIPFNEGFVRTETPIVGEDIVAMIGKMQAAATNMGV